MAEQWVQKTAPSLVEMMGKERERQLAERWVQLMVMQTVDLLVGSLAATKAS